MYSPKNLSPQQLSFLTALAISLPASLLLFFWEPNFKIVLIFFTLLFSLSFGIVFFTISRFIYRKIKLIYKFIYQTKATKREETFFKYILQKKSIDEVNDDVIAWAEENKKEIELLRKNEQFRKEFLQNLSHEFKTPVFAIQGYVESLLDGGMHVPETNKRFLQNTFKNVERLSHLIKDLDEISKLERGELILVKSNFCIQDIVKEVFESLAVKAELRPVCFIIKNGCELPLTVFADKEKIRQVLSNLVDNSIKFGKPNGNTIASMYAMDDDRVLIEITDNGIGISENHIPRIFERFFRTEEGRSIDITGSGLGLAICKHIVEAHGQTIHVRSTPDVGTSIGFTLENKKG